MTRYPLRRLWPLLPLLVILLLIIFWDWNWFKPIVERQASQALDRRVSIDDLDVDLSWYPDIRLSGITVANPQSFPAEADPVVTVRLLALRLGLRALFDRRVMISTLELDAPVARLHADAKGVRNWQFTLPHRDPESEQPWLVQLDSLTIREGEFSLVDRALKADIRGIVRSGEPKLGEEPRVFAEANGRYRGEPFKARFVGGSVLSLRTPENPYPVDFDAQSGGTRVDLKGTLLDPLQFGGAKLRLLLQGPNLSRLADFTRLPLPNTPPYKLEGNLDYRYRNIIFRNFTGLIGESDMAGNVSVRLIKPRPLLEATVRSKQVRLADLSGLIGADPNAPPAASPAGDGKLLPAKPINVPRLQNTDVRFNFTGESIQGDKLPFDRLAFKLTLDDGVMRFSPADFGIGEGALRLFATLDPRGKELGLEAKAELKRVNIARIMEKTSYKGSGRIGGFAVLKAKGRSAAELLGTGNGELKLAMVGGDFSSLLLDLVGLDFGNATLSLLGITPRTEVRCLVGDFQLQDGLLNTRAFILDTGNTNLLLDGGANFKEEKLDLRLRTKPKRANIARLKAPIHIKGTFADPDISPDLLDIGVRAGAAVSLGVLLTPLAALLPTLQLGPGEDRDCKALLTEAEVTAPPQPAAK